MLGDALDELFRRPRFGVELHPVAPVALDLPLDPEKKVRPDRLRTGVAAPHAAEERVGEKEGQRCDNQQAGEIVHLLRPELNEEAIEPLMRNIDENRLVRQARPTIPSYEGNDVVDAEGCQQYNPFDAPVSSPDPLRVDFLGHFIQWAVVVDLLGGSSHFEFVLFGYLLAVAGCGSVLLRPRLDDGALEAVGVERGSDLERTDQEHRRALESEITALIKRTATRPIPSVSRARRCS